MTSHCEDLKIINGGIINKGEISEKLGVKGMDRASEDYITAREICLAMSCNARVHICHVSTKGSVNIIRAAKKDGVKVTCETAPHYFTFTDEKLLARDADFRMSPPLRTEEDRAAVEEAVLDGTIDCIITDHAPHSAEEKADFEKAPNGVVGLETSLAATLTKLYHSGKCGLNKIAEIMSVNPRKIMGLEPIKIAVGERCDLCIFDPGYEWEVIPAELNSKSKNSVFKGTRLKGKVMYTICRGKLVLSFNIKISERKIKMAFDRLIENIVKTQNPSVVGLDPKLDYVPEYIKEKKFKKYGKTLKGAAKAIWEFNKTIIDEIHDICPAIKPQAAYYEMYGYEGVKTLYKTIQYAKEKGMFVMTDGKRNDIGATMEAYATAHLGLTDVGGELVEAFGADALTVNGYLGSDGINPLLDQCRKYDKGIFVLVKTSNKSSGELQDLMIGNKTVYATMGSMCELWGKDVMGKYGYSGVGAVVGATYPEQLAEMRKALPHTFFLVPGYGAQGGGAEGVSKAFDDHGLGAIVNSSRGVMCAYKKEDNCDEHDFAKAARREVIRMKEDIISYLPKITLE